MSWSITYNHQSPEQTLVDTPARSRANVCCRPLRLHLRSRPADVLARPSQPDKPKRILVLQTFSDMRQSKIIETSLALREGLGRHTTAPNILFRVMHVRRNLQDLSMIKGSIQQVVCIG